MISLPGKYSDLGVSHGEAFYRSSSQAGSLLGMDSRSKTGVLFITSFPPRECGIATYSQDLISALEHQFGRSFRLEICVLESDEETPVYETAIRFHLNTDHQASFQDLSRQINRAFDLDLVVVQHEFGFFRKQEKAFAELIAGLTKPLVLVFHTVLPHPDDALKQRVLAISGSAHRLVVMTQNSARILEDDYGIDSEKITVIPHGTHLVPHKCKDELKKKYGLEGRKVLSTFGLLGRGKNIESTLLALPAIRETNPDVVFLILGKSHPNLVKQEGERYRAELESRVASLRLEKQVRFINRFLPLPVLLEYLQLTDIYLFTSHDPNQAVSGTFSYAISCGCPIISTPIPHAREVLGKEAGVLVDFVAPDQLARAALYLLANQDLRNSISSHALHRMASTAWENSALAHACLFMELGKKSPPLSFNLPKLNLDHIKKMTTDFGILQFSKINQPDLSSGYTLDDNARALVAMLQHYELFGVTEDLKSIQIYLDFMAFCQQKDGNFLNYVDAEKNFTHQNSENLEDANGRAVWALGFLISLWKSVPEALVDQANAILGPALRQVHHIHSTRAMAFIVKGLYYRHLKTKSILDSTLIRQLANRLLQMYRHESEGDWIWFESYLTYANSILPESMLCAWLATGETVYKKTALDTFTFLLSKIFVNGRIEVVSNQGWLKKEYPKPPEERGGEQPIDVAYTLMALAKFHQVFPDKGFDTKMKTAMDWFLGNNHLNQIVYNPCTGGCYDGLEQLWVNLNQGAESTLSYLMARLTYEKVLRTPISFREKESLRLA